MKKRNEAVMSRTEFCSWQTVPDEVSEVGESEIWGILQIRLYEFTTANNLFYVKPR
jgi:hypothetical protein